MFGYLTLLLLFVGSEVAQSEKFHAQKISQDIKGRFACLKRLDGAWWCP